MQTDFEIDAAGLKIATEQAYGFEFEEMTFVPKGEDSWCYRLRTNADDFFFLKLHLHQDYEKTIFRLPAQLADAGFESSVIPLATKKGEYYFNYQGRFAILLPWLDGHELMGHRVTPEIATRIGRLLADFHMAGKELEWSIKENFGNPFQTKLDAVLKEVHRGVHPDPFVEKFRLLFLSQIKELETENKKFNQVGQRCKVKTIQYTVTHGDPHLANVFQKPDGDLALIDWHDVKWAPIERDLRFFEDDWSAVAYRGYEQVAGPIELDADLLEYYRLTWNVGEAMDIGWRMFFTKQDDARKEFYYKELDHFFDYSGIRSKK